MWRRGWPANATALIRPMRMSAMDSIQFELRLNTEPYPMNSTDFALVLVYGLAAPSGRLLRRSRDRPASGMSGSIRAEILDTARSRPSRHGSRVRNCSAILDGVTRRIPLAHARAAG